MQISEQLDTTPTSTVLGARAAREVVRSSARAQYLMYCQHQVDRCDYCGRLARRVRGVALCSTCSCG